MRHVTVYAEDDIYAGWPANHGAWQWGNEFLVGFLRGPFKDWGHGHRIREPFEKVQARSLDGGETWAVEKPNLDFEASSDDVFRAENANGYASLIAFRQDRDILRFCGNYDHGGEYCARAGGVYLSVDKGKWWLGPYSLGDGFQLGYREHVTTRTCVLGDLIFISLADRRMWGTDYVICLKWNGTKFYQKSIVLSDEYRAVMPAVAMVGDRIVVTMRRRGGRALRGGWIDCVYSDDGGDNWSAPIHVADTGNYNGNPPALIANGSILYCAYGNRSTKEMWVSYSNDGGKTWPLHQRLRKSENEDIGYPRLFKRDDGKLVCVYYWSGGDEPQRIEATIF